MRLTDPDPLSEATTNTLSLLPPLQIFRTIAHAPTVLDPWLGLGGTLLSALGLDPVLRELVIVQIASDTNCAYEQRQHEEIALAAGASSKQIHAVRETRLGDPALTAVAPVLRVVHELTTTHGCSETSMAELRVSLPDRSVVELLLVVGFYLGLAVLINAVELDPDEPDGLALLGLPQRDGS